MKLVMTLLVRDEEDIVAANIDYHLSRGVDFIIATDNLSEDSTAEILAEYRSAGVLEYIRETSDDYQQAQWVTRMAHLARDTHRADWIIHNDADEFWWPDAAASIKEVLAEVPEHCQGVVVERTNFLPWTEPRPGAFHESMIIRETASANAMSGRLLPKVAHRNLADVEVAQGNHQVLIGDTPIITCAVPLSILHFPLRSYEQFENKIVKGGAAYERNTKLPPRVGRTWRHLYEVYRQGGLPDAYRRESVTDAEATERVSSGGCVVDTRLRDYMIDQGGDERSPDRE